MRKGAMFGPILGHPFHRGSDRRKIEQNLYKIRFFSRLPPTRALLRWCTVFRLVRPRRGPGRPTGEAAWSKRGNKDRCKIRQNPTKIPHFKVFARRDPSTFILPRRWPRRWRDSGRDGRRRTRAKISLFKYISAPKIAAAVAAGRYGGGIIIAPEYKPAAGARRSRGALYSLGLRLGARGS